MNKRQTRSKRGEGKPQRPPFSDIDASQYIPPLPSCDADRSAVERFNDAVPTTRQLQAEYDKRVIGHFDKTGEAPSFGGHLLPLQSGEIGQQHVLVGSWSKDVAQRFAVEWHAATHSGDTEKMETVIAKYEVQRQTLDLQTLLAGARDVLRELTVPQPKLVKPTLSRNRKRSRPNSDADARREIVRNNLNLSSKRLCELFRDAKVSLPRGWLKQFRGFTWPKAYQDGILRRRIYKIISDDKSRY
jgi:hypothetical protein